MKLKIVFFFLFLNCLFAFSQEPFQVLKEFENEDCYLTLIENAVGQHFIVKQVKDENPDEQFLLIIDVCASNMGRSCGVPLNDVSLIPAYFPFPGKQRKHLPASLHTVVPGVAVQEQIPWEEFSIHQRYHRPLALEAIWGKLPQEQKGLTRQMALNMERHIDLVKICAFDTFVGNGDRSNPNVFYDRLSDRFWGIDMAASFNSLLAETLCERIALPELYFHTLRDLHQLFPPAEVEKLLQHYLTESGYFLENDEEVENRLSHHMRVFSKNYAFISLILNEHFN